MGTRWTPHPRGKSLLLCARPRCPKKHGSRSPYCHKHSKQDWRARNPLKYAYENLKRSANLRKIGFELSLEEFEKFCAETNYLELKGCHAGDMHIDRIRHREGYNKDNIRLLECTKNCAKATWERNNKFDYPELVTEGQPF